MTLGQNILELRKKKGLSQEQLGEKINVTRQTISNWELEETSPNPTQLKLLSQTLEVSVDELLNNNIISSSSKLKISTKHKNKLKKILKIFIIIIIILLIIDIISLIICYTGNIGPFINN